MALWVCVSWLCWPMCRQFAFWLLCNKDCHQFAGHTGMQSHDTHTYTTSAKWWQSRLHTQCYLSRQVYVCHGFVSLCVMALLAYVSSVCILAADRAGIVCATKTVISSLVTQACKATTHTHTYTTSAKWWQYRLQIQCYLSQQCDWWSRHARLNLTRSRMGSQWSLHSDESCSGVLYRLQLCAVECPVDRRAANYNNPTGRIWTPQLRFLQLPLSAIGRTGIVVGSVI